MGGSKRATRDNAAKNLRNWRKELFLARAALVVAQHKYGQDEIAEGEYTAAAQRYARAEEAVSAAVERYGRIGVVLSNEYGRGARE